ncbi:MAG: ABC transporter permease [Eubacteriaceae bacterium]|nr:ABC transporter permease [Eubacteriaceae bacterium]
MEIVNIVKEHIAWRSQIGKLAKADLKKTYSGAALGWAWAIIKPAVTIFVYWFAFSTGMRHTAGIAGFPFFLWMLAGIVPWFYVTEMLNQGTDAMRKYKHLITKMKFPVSTIPTFVSLSKLTVHLILLACVFVIYALMGYIRDPIYYLQLPLYMLMLFLFCTGWALFGSVLAAMSKDFLNLVKSFTMALFWLSGILFSITNIDVGWVRTLMKCNPVTFTVEGYRNCFVYHKWFFEDPKWLLVYLAEMIVMWVLAVWAFKKLKKDMPDVL